MRTEAEIRHLIDAIEADPRCPRHAGGTHPGSTLHFNPRLALWQIGMSAARGVLLWMLGGEHHGLGVGGGGDASDDDDLLANLPQAGSERDATTWNNPESENA